MDNNNYLAKKADFSRFYGTCGYCKKDKFFVKRVEIDAGGVKVISPSHFCKECAIITVNKLTKQNA